MDLTAQITARLERLKADIQQALADNKINASGRTSKSLQVMQTERGVKLAFVAGDKAPAQTLEIGREAGAVPKGFYAIIKRWSEEKGLQFATERKRNTFAYLTARKIANEGTKRHKEPIDVYSTLVAECAEDIKKIVGATIREQIKLNF